MIYCAQVLKISLAVMIVLQFISRFSIFLQIRGAPPKTSISPVVQPMQLEQELSAGEQ
jgi:hypothetical protein